MAWKHFAPYVPEAANPFDERKAAHLLRRAGFGASRDEIAAAVEKGLEQTVEDLFDAAENEQQEFQKVFDSINGRMANFADPGQCQAWWVHRMLATRVPLREKLTLFWHGHFATSIRKVENTGFMVRQVDMVRRHAWGNFRDLVLAVAKDAAMLVWLDGQTSTKEHPNENFARELMELFTCGIGHYTEQDVLEAARAFTGWHRNGSEFAFNGDAHDYGVKKFLGKRGKFDGTDIIDILMAQPATSRFIAGKLLRFFACPDPPEPVLAEAAEMLDRQQLNIKWFLRELFSSQFFFSPDCHRKRIASPVEFAIGTLRTLGVRQPAQDLVGNMNAMGQELLAPPNVKGWDGEQKWINSTSLAARVAFAQNIAGFDAGENGFSPHCPIDELVPGEMKSPEQIVERLASLLFQGELPADTQREMAAFLLTNDQGPQPAAFRDDAGFRLSKTRELLGILLSLPEYQTV